VVGLDVFKDFDFGDVGELICCGGASAILVGGAFCFLRCLMCLKDLVVVELAVFLDFEKGAAFDRLGRSPLCARKQFAVAIANLIKPLEYFDSMCLRIGK
jgi:hypothetical protein